MKTTEHTAKSASTSKAGFFATVRVLLGGKGSAAPSSLRRTTLAGLLLTLFSIAALAGATPALAEGECLTCKPWWHLSSGARPTYLSAGHAHPGEEEVQEITEKLTEFGGHPEQGAFVLSVGKKELGTFATEPIASEFELLAITEAEVQKALEGPYGKGAVHTKIKTEEPEPGIKVLHVRVESPAGSEPIEVAGFSLEEPSVAVVTPGKAPAYDGVVAVLAEDLGNASVNGASSPVVIKDELPEGLTAVGVIGTEPAPHEIHKRIAIPCTIQSPKVVTCEMTKSLLPYDELEVRIGVEVSATAKTGEENAASIVGGEAPSASISRKITISSAPTPFGVEDYELVNEQEGGALDTQAGSHPFQQTTSISLNEAADSATLSSAESFANPAALAKDLNIKWPPGLIGNPTPVPRCTIGQFLAVNQENGEENECPADSAVGVALVTVRDFTLGTTLKFPLPLFNLEPAEGEPARFGFYVIIGNSPVVIDSAVRSGSDYGVNVLTNNITQTAGFLSAEVTVWGAPQAASHDGQRGWGCLYTAKTVPFPHAPCPASKQQQLPPFLSLPTSCTGTSQTTIEADSWAQPGAFQKPVSFQMPALDGCNKLPFSPSIHVSPDVQEASKPSGLTTDVHVNQEEALNPAGLAPADVRDIKVALPEGLDLNPAAADGLTSCSEAQIGFTGFAELNPSSEPGAQTPQFTPDEPSCPNAAKIATAEITTPILPNPLKGFVYLAAPQNFSGPPPENPFQSLVAMYLVARDPVSGVLVKLPGSVSLSSTGQITATFADNPQAPFEDAKLSFFGGERAPLATPALCRRPGEEGYRTLASMTPWSGGEPTQVSSEFYVTSGPGGGACPNAPGDQSPSTLPFGASLASATTNINAGSFSPLTTTLSRPDGNQSIQSVVLHYPPGVSGMLSGVPLCPEAQANAGTCGAESLIGETIVSVGLGGDPFTVTGGKVYLTEKYAGAPFGLSIVNPAKAGPFNLQEGRPVVVRAKIDIDTHTAALTITTGQIPRIIEGFPLQIKHVNVLVNRPGFTFNPTSCAPMGITGALGAWEGASSPLSVPFQVTNCALLKFKPTITVTTAAKTSKKEGSSLVFKIGYPKGAMGSQSWFNEAKFDLPKQLPARLTTIQKACLASVFEANPAACPSASLIGHAVVRTQVLPVPLAGPVYFVSHGGAKFPDAVIVLQGYGVKVNLVGETFINGKTNVTSATFRNTPDVPFESIEVTVPSGPFSEFGSNLPASAHGSFCGQKLVMPTLFKAQNGLEIHQNTAVGVSGCGKAKTRSQLLTAALKACHKKHSKSKRKGCEAQARKRYGPKAAKAKKSAKKGRRS